MENVTITNKTSQSAPDTLTAKKEFITSFIGFAVIALILFLFYFCCYALADAENTAAAVSYSRSFFEHFTWGGLKHFFSHFSLLKAASGWGFFRVVLHDLSGILVALVYLLIAAISVSVFIGILRLVLGVLLPFVGHAVVFVIGAGGLVLIWNGFRWGDFQSILIGVGMLVLAILGSRLFTFISTHILGCSEEELDEAITDAYLDSL